MTTTSLVDIAKGEPDFHTPDFIKRAAREAIEANFTKYTPQPGIPELREAAARKLRTENGIDAAPEDIVITCGGKHAVEMSIRCLIAPGDEAIMITPHWFAYPGQVRMAGGTAILVAARETDGFVPNVEAVSDAITSRTRLIILNSPANPTGAVYPRRFLEAVAALAVGNDLHVLSDEVYEKVLFNGAQHASIASLGGGIAERTVTVNSVSKTHAMTGWRIGYGLLPGGLAKRVIGIQELSTSAPCAVSQRAALAALTGGQSHVAAMTDAYAVRREFLCDRIAAIPGLDAVPPRGTFYCLVSIRGLKGHSFGGSTVNNADDFARVAEEVAGVRVLSGVPFGAPEHIRVSFAVSSHAIEEGMARLERLIVSGE
jgi:aspartate aminotransferase